MVSPEIGNRVRGNSWDHITANSCAAVKRTIGIGALLRLPPTIRYDISLVFTDLHLFLFLQRAL